MLHPGNSLVLATQGIILLLFVLGVYWAHKSGQFEDTEAAKFAMLKNDEDYRDEA